MYNRLLAAINPSKTGGFSRSYCPNILPSAAETAISTAGLDATLDGPGPWTLFAPTDDAFDNLPGGVLASLLGDPDGALTDVLLYHVVNEAGAIRVIGRELPGLAVDRSAQALLLGWVFGSFLQGASGFGVPAAVVAPLLFGLGFAANSAVVMSRAC